MRKFIISRKMQSQVAAVFVAVIIALTMLLTSMTCDAAPLLGHQTNFEDLPRSQGHPKPVFVHCDEIGNHLNCMLYCRSRGHTSGNCLGDFTCNCF